jgi:threonylcarbamoyladenosine tRNA methylthiotransferase MtaB
MRHEETMLIYLTSLGCKLNQSEMDALANRLTAHGHTIVAESSEADLCVLNTCAVTHVAAQKSRQALRRLHRDNPHARLVATGCYAELAPRELDSLPGIVSVVGNQAKGHLEELICEQAGALGDYRPDRTISSYLPWVSAIRRTRALVKIQDGCDNACTYCIIRVARGSQQSRPIEQVLAEVQALVSAGHQEIVLTGVHIGAYGQDRRGGPGGEDLWALVRRILLETDLPRLRLSSIEPWDLPEHAFRLWDDTRLCRHLHLPLQSGSDATLRHMARRYDTTEFAALVSTARAAIPDLAVTTDIIVGFPRESEAQFAESLDFVQRQEFARVHVFPYSLRAGTLAAKMPEQVAPAIKTERARAMRTVAAASEQAFRRQFVGRTMDVLWETPRQGKDGLIWSGLTSNYLRVHTNSSENLANTLTRTRLIALAGGGLRGQIETQKSGG